MAKTCFTKLDCFRVYCALTYQTADHLTLFLTKLQNNILNTGLQEIQKEESFA